jgi:hypothetical protein
MDYILNIFKKNILKVVIYYQYLLFNHCKNNCMTTLGTMSSKVNDYIVVQSVMLSM